MGVEGNQRYFQRGTEHFSSSLPTPLSTSASTPIPMAGGMRALQKLVGSRRRVAVVVVAVSVAKSDRYGTSTTVATITSAGHHGTQSWTYWVCPIQSQANYTT